MADNGNIDVAHWQRLSALLDEVLALEPEARAAWIERLPPEHVDLIPVLRQMLQRDADEAQVFLSRPITLPEVLRAAVGSDDAAGKVIGPYRLLAELGAGGMGTVWIAERSDGSIKRRVALKLPISRWVPGLAERMRRERDILASLEHPNIARLYDAGVTYEGRPYLALEFVEGRPIDAFCREHRLDVAARLRLFLQVAQAVSHAHGRLVVHRDIKPGNILVTAEGEVRLLDFGIAKLLDGAAEVASVASTQLTRITGRALTLGYASPEQIRQEQATIASDVYSLGVVLFELLTSQRPYKLKRDSAAAIEDAIIEQEAPTASSVARKDVAKVLRGDLDVILTKALKKPVAERYRSVESFAGDIARYLAGEPVLAQPDSTWYRTGKFVHRNVGAVAAGAAVLVAIGVGSGVALWQARVARVEAARAEEVKNFIASIFSSAVPRTGVGGEVLATDLLSAASLRIENELAGNPRVAAELGVIVGESFGELGERQKGEQVLRVAIARAEQAHGRRHPITIRGRVQLSHAIRDRDARGAEALMDEAIADAVTLLPSAVGPLMDAWSGKGSIAARREAPEEAYAGYQQALALAEKYFGPRGEEAIYNLSFLANAYGRFGDYAAQMATASDARQRAHEKFAARRPNMVLAAAERAYADAVRTSDRPADAIPLLRRVLDDQQRLDAAETFRVRNVLSQLALALAAAGRTDESLRLLRKVVALEQEQNKFESEDRVNAGAQLADVLLTAARVDEAYAEDERVIAVQARLAEDSPRLRLQRTLRRALLLAHRNEPAEAERMALNAAADAGMRYPRSRIEALRVAAFNARLQRKPELAIRYLRDAAGVNLAQPAPLPLLFDAVSERGAALLDLARFDEAEKAFLECRQLYEKAQVTLSVRVSTCVVGFARIQLRKQQFADAGKALRTLAADWEQLNPGSVWHGETLYWLAQAQEHLGQQAEARANLARARAMLGKSSLPALRALAVR